MTISRRVFVKSGGLALVSFGLDPLFLARAAFATNRPSGYPPNRPILVCLFQRGAVDGLNMIVPHGDALYYRERPRIAVPATDVIDLDGYFGDRKSTRLNSSHLVISYAVFCLKKKKKIYRQHNIH